MHIFNISITAVSRYYYYYYKIIVSQQNDLKYGFTTTLFCFIR